MKSLNKLDDDKFWVDKVLETIWKEYSTDDLKTTNKFDPWLWDVPFKINKGYYNRNK